MKYGFFDDNNREYVITSPNTPLPWINYLGCDNFFSLISNTCGGYSFYKDAKLLRLTRYRYNNIPQDTNGRYYFIKDNDVIWNPGWQPTRTSLDEYSCRHGLGYSMFTSSKNDLKAKLLAFVPLNSNCEINQLKLKNNSSSPKSISLFSYIEFCLWNAVDDMTNFQRNLNIGEVEIQGSEIYHKTEYRERRNHYAVYSVNTSIQGFDTSRDAFLGHYGNLESPEVVEKEASANSIAHGWSPIGSHHIKIDLLPGEEKSFIFILGYLENAKDEKWESPGIINKSPAKELLARFNTDEKVETALSHLKEHWNKLLSNFQIHTEDDKLNRMVNIWNQYQCMVTFNMSRSASYYESGTGRGMGFRDSCQDLLGFVHLIPDRARERILDIAATQFEDGSAYHQYQPLTKKGNLDIGSGFNDDPLWLIACVSAYIRETGDFDILNEPVPFDNDESKAKPLMEHLRRSFTYTKTNLGPHNLPLIGRADWNDCLNLNCFSEEPGESFQTASNYESYRAESIFIAAMFVRYGKEYADICQAIGLKAEAEAALLSVEEMIQAVLKDGWDGEWFLRAYDAFGEKIGSQECKEGQIFIEPQGFAVLAGIGIQEGYATKALDSVAKRLETKYGVVLLEPCYTEYQLNLGEISSYPPGYKENGGIFCHNNPWISIAETMIGRGDRAFSIYSKICPAYIEDISDIHRTEPYVYSQMIAGKEAATHGEAKNSWLTGTAAWTFVNISQYILGIMPTLEGLTVNPCIPKNMKEFSVVRNYRGAAYHIQVFNPNGVEKGIAAITVDGQKVPSNLIPIEKDKTEYHINITMG